MSSRNSTTAKYKLITQETWSDTKMLKHHYLSLHDNTIVSQILSHDSDTSLKMLHANLER